MRRESETPNVTVLIRHVFGSFASGISFRPDRICVRACAQHSTFENDINYYVLILILRFTTTIVKMQRDIRKPCREICDNRHKTLIDCRK